MLCHPLPVVSQSEHGIICAILYRQVTGPWDVFVEYAYRFPERGGPQHLLHFGTALTKARQAGTD